MSDVFDKVCRMLKDKEIKAIGEIKMESNLVSDLGYDSLDLIEIMMAVEEEFEIEISDHEAENIKTVAELVAYIEQNAPK